MARPRTPRAKAAVEGADKKNPQRFRGRNDVGVDGPLGDPPAWLVDTDTNMARSAWVLFADELPWLNKSHRALVGMAASVRGRLIAGQDVGVQALNLLRQCLGQMGATPADATKVSLPDDEDEKDDILD